MEPSKYPETPLNLTAMRILSFQAAQLVPSNLSDSERIGSMFPPDVVMICDVLCMCNW